MRKEEVKETVGDEWSGPAGKERISCSSSETGAPADDDLLDNAQLSFFACVRAGATVVRPASMSTVFNFTFVPWFRSVAPYIHLHRGKTFVVALAGEAIAAGKLPAIAQDIALIQSMGVKVVLIHGFRPQVNEQLAAKGHAASYSHGIRITDSVALDCAQEAAGQLRYEIEAAFSQGLPNTPMAGSQVRVISGNFVTARPVGIVDGVDFKHSGLVRKVDTAGILRSLDFGAMVLLSPFGFSPTGEAFNLTMEEVATRVAVELQADKLIFLTEVPGVATDADASVSEDNPIDTEIPLAAAQALLSRLRENPPIRLSTFSIA
jgi:amino-acid N-acetyltransferase